MDTEEFVDVAGDEIVAAAREKIKQDGWENAIEATVFMNADAFKNLTDALDMDDYDEDTRELFGTVGIMAAMLMAMMAERRGVDLAKGRVSTRKGN